MSTPRIINKWMIGLALSLLIALAITAVVLAAAGDLLQTVAEPEPMVSCCGIGVEYDGTQVMYTHYGDRKIHFTDFSGVDLGELPLLNPDGSPYTGDCCNAIAFNFSDGFLYGGGWSSTNLYSVDLSTGVVTLVKANAIPPYIGFIDGLAWDPRDNTFWMSDDISCNVRHLDSLGNDIGGFDGCAVTGYFNSGLAMGLDGTLFYGTNGYGRIFSLDTTTSPPTNLGQFASPGGRDEDMSCGPLFTKPDGSVVETLLSQDAYNNTFVVIEMEPGKCIHPQEDPVEVAKDYRYTDVCFERDNDLDGLFSEDPLDWVDNDGDGFIDEDGDDCLNGSYTGTPLPMDANGAFVVQAVLKKDGTVSSYNPGQFYAVSTVTALTDLETLWIGEEFGDCSEAPKRLSALNPVTGGGGVVIVMIGPDGVAKQIFDANSPNVSISDANFNGIPDDAEAYLEDVPKDTIILMYVKFAPGLKGLPLPAEPLRTCENFNSAWVEEGGNEFSASAKLTVAPK